MTNQDYEKEILAEMEEQQKNSRQLTFIERVWNFFLRHKWHSVFLTTVAIITAIACVPMHRLGDTAGINSLARERLNEEISIKEKEYRELTVVRDDLVSDIKKLEQNSAENGDVNIRMKENEETIAGLNAAITEAEALSVSLDKQLETKKQTSSQVNSITSITPGATKALKAGDYRCPGAIKPGTYKITGESGNILLYDISNSIRVSKNLETLDGNEFTLAISEGEKLKVDKNVKITSMN